MPVKVKPVKVPSPPPRDKFAPEITPENVENGVRGAFKAAAQHIRNTLLPRFAITLPDGLEIIVIPRYLLDDLLAQIERVRVSFRRD